MVFVFERLEGEPTSSKLHSGRPNLTIWPIVSLIIEIGSAILDFNHSSFFEKYLSLVLLTPFAFHLANAFKRKFAMIEHSCENSSFF